MSEKARATVLFSFLEYRASYLEPIFGFLKLHDEICRAVFQGFRPWNVSLENISFKQNPLNLSEVSTTFALLAGRVAFNVGLGATSLLVTNPAWSERDAILEMAKAGLAAVRNSSGAVIEKQRMNIGLHLKPLSGSIKDCVSNIALPTVSQFLGDDVRTYGISIYKQDSTWLVDASASYPGALFVKIERVVGAEVPLPRIAGQMDEDEKTVLELLKLEIE